ncbi:MAG: cell division protein FtsZ [Candidatus Methanoperedens sp.]|nr:cell division protein FtsZ [Candidatus Methanoperedens sp.]MCZ7369612.1 cell division protein FtsZ [Candidatus Methanoperedens sp.]
MESFVQDALKMAEKEQQLKRAATGAAEDVDDFGTPKIVVVGCGGGGNNTVNRLYNIGIAGADTIAINTDKIHLDITQADKKILIGKSITRGLGAGGFPEIGKRAAELARGTLEEVLKNANLVFVTAGMGGGTGTGVAPVVAQIAKDQGAIVIGMVTSPFRVERARMVKAEEGLDDLRNCADTVIVLDNNRLLDYVPNLPIDQAFSVMDQLISETVKGIAETITQPSLINLDYADVRAIMKGGGLAVMLVGEAKGQDKANEVVRAALNHPLLDVDTTGATGCLLHITGGPDMSLHEAEQIASSLTYELDSHANVIWGARVRKDYESKVRCMAIMTGIKSAQIMGPSEQRNASRNSSPAVEERIRVPAGRATKGSIIDQIM